jgi:hypothetical protein
MIGRIAVRAIGTNEEAVLQVPSEGQALIHAIYLVNGSTSMRRVRIHHLKPGEATGIGNALLYDGAIAPRSSLIDETRFAMEGGDSLIFKADGSDVGVVIEGQRMP